MTSFAPSLFSGSTWDTYRVRTMMWTSGFSWRHSRTIRRVPSASEIAITTASARLMEAASSPSGAAASATIARLPFWRATRARSGSSSMTMCGIFVSVSTWATFSPFRP